MTEDEIIAGVIAKEGGYNDRADDSGGPTNFGVTLATWQAWRRDMSLTKYDLMRMERSEAEQIYRQDYIRKPGFDRIAHAHLRVHVIDFGVNSGQPTAARMLQKVLGVRQDTKIGPKTLGAIEAMGAVRVSNRLMLERIRLQGKICVRRPKDLANLNGWLGRSMTFFIEV